MLYICYVATLSYQFFVCLLLFLFFVSILNHINICVSLVCFHSSCFFVVRSLYYTSFAQVRNSFVTLRLEISISFDIIWIWLRTDGEWEVALALLHHMLSLSHQPDGRILGSVVNCLRAKAGSLSRDLFVVRFVTVVQETVVVIEAHGLAWDRQ